MSDNLSFGVTGVSRFSGQRGRTAGGMAQNGTRYPNPFFDIGHTYLPPTLKILLKWCRYYYLVHPLINTIIHKLAEYPVTDIIIDETDPVSKQKWEQLLDKHLRYRAFQIECGLDYFCYGTSITTIHFPFIKYLQCASCKKFKEKATRCSYKWRDYNYILSCPQCGHHGPAIIEDFFMKDVKGIRLQRWNPENVHIEPGFAGMDPTYTFELPMSQKNDLILGKRSTLDTIPDIFVEAAKRGKFVAFDKSNVFVMKRPIISQKDEGWGMPLILPIMKDAYYLQILRKAQECVSLNTPIETKQGFVTADKVSIGDLVRTHRGNWKQVTNKWYREAKENELGRKITLSGLRHFPATYSPQHPILTLNRNGINRRSDSLDTQRSSVILRNQQLWEEVFTPAAKLGVGNYVLYPRSLITENQEIDVAKYTGMVATRNYVYSGVSLATAHAFECESNGQRAPSGNSRKTALRTIRNNKVPKRMVCTRPLTEDLAYILGWYTGDGSCNQRTILFNLNINNPHERLITAISNEFSITPKQHIRGQLRNLVVGDVIVRNLIKGLVPGTARVKKVPEEVMNAPDSVKLAFLKGLWEADGHIREEQAMLATASQELAYDAYRLLLHLGCIPTISYRTTSGSVIATTGQEIVPSDSYQVTVSTASKDRLMSLWATGKGKEILSGKSGFFWKQYFASRICSVEEVNEEQYIDFKVADDATFCTPGTATKNCIMLDHIVPMRILFPQANSATSDPYSTISLDNWRHRVENEIGKFRLDPNYTAIMPLPIGKEVLGGDGKALMLTEEMKAWSEQIIAGMGVPRELVYGGLSFTGSSVSMRILENSFLGYRTDQDNMLNEFVIRRIADFMEWPAVKAHMSKFKMADDLQRLSLTFQLNQADKISDQTLIQEAGHDPTVEKERRMDEMGARLEYQRKMQDAQAQMQASAGIVQMKGQIEAQKMQQEAMPQPMPGDPNNPEGQPQQGQPQPGQPPMPGQPPASGQEGAMIPGEQAAPGMPEGSTVDTGNMMEQPEDVNAPIGAASPLTMGTAGGGPNLLYLAKRAAATIEKLDPMAKSTELNKMRGSNPQLYALVLRLIQGRLGSQEDPLDAVQSPLPEQKPSRRAAKVGV